MRRLFTRKYPQCTHWRIEFNSNDSNLLRRLNVKYDYLCLRKENRYFLSNLRSRSIFNSWNSSSADRLRRNKKQTKINSLSIFFSGQLTPSNLTAYIVNAHTLSVTWDFPSNVNAIEKVYITVTQLGSKNRTILSQSLDNTVKKLDIPIHAHNPSSKRATISFRSYSNSLIVFFAGIHPNRTVLFSARCSDRNGQNSSTIEYQLYVNMFSKLRFLPLFFQCVKLLKICMDLMRKNKDIFISFTDDVVLTERHPVVKACIHTPMNGNHYYIWFMLHGEDTHKNDEKWSIDVQTKKKEPLVNSSKDLNEEDDEVLTFLEISRSRICSIKIKQSD